jgi:hypothetical protein
MNWFKKLFGIKEVESQGLQIKESYHPHRGTSKTDDIDATKQKRIKEIVEAERIRRDEINESVRKRKVQEDESSFLTSMAFAAMTDSSILGYAAGGNMAGAILGDVLNDSNNTYKDSIDNTNESNYSHESDSSDYGHSNDSTSYDSSSSYDSGSSSSYDSGSSYDSSSSSSNDY